MSEETHKLNTLIHLYETAHSGFYGDNPSETVNLVPKTWTRYTVTDGNWMSPKTVEPLVLRDIYLANKIDEAISSKNSHYKAGKHIIIDYDTNTISVNPFDFKYEYTNGILNTNYEVYTDLPKYDGGAENRLILTNSGLSYSFVSGNKVYDYINCDISSVSAGGITAEGSLSSFPSGVNLVYVTSAIYEYENSESNSGECISGYEIMYDEYAGQKVRHDFHGEWPSVTGTIVSGRLENVFNPSDEREFDIETLTGGSNYIVLDHSHSMGPKNNITMVPTGVMFIYD